MNVIVENKNQKIILVLYALCIPPLLGFCGFGAKFNVGNLFAQNFTASVNRNRMVVGEQFQITFEIDANINTFKAPNFNDFNVYSGPNQSTSMQFINGNMSQSLSYSYILAPKHEGKFTIGSAIATIGGKSFQTRPINIEVSKGNTQSQQNQSQQNQQQGSRQQQGGNANSTNEELGDKLFIRAITSKSKVYQGEQLTVLYKIYTKVDIVDFAVTKMPVYNGFYNDDLGDGKRQVTLQNENIDGVNYRVAEIKKTLLIPQRSGSLEIDPLEMDIIARVKTNKRSNDPFDIFFGGGFFGGVQDVKVHVKSKTVKINVMPLPNAGKPANFNGAVGDFSIQSKIKPNSQKLKTNEAGNVSYSISGKGNLKLIDAFKVEWPADIEGYDAKTIDHIQATPSGLSGSRTFDYVFIPRHSGSFTIPNQNFAFFDPIKAKYVTLSTPDFKLEIEKGAGGESTVNTITSNATQEEVKVLGNDIRYIKPNTSLKEINTNFYGSAIYYLLLLLPAFAFGGFLIAKKRNENMGADVVGFRMKQANKIANTRLKNAFAHMNNNLYNDFYKEVLDALYGYISYKFALPVAQLNKDNINRLLEEKGTTTITIAKLNDVLNNCEFAQYAPTKDLTAMQNDYNSAVEIITNIEENLKA